LLACRSLRFGFANLMATVLTMLSIYLDEVLDEPWSWGSMDCCFFAGNWIRNATGRDPLGPYRGVYSSALSARRLIAIRGGLPDMVDAEMLRTGFKLTTLPEDGDIAVADLIGDGPNAVAQASVVIRVGPWWVGRSLSGLANIEAEPAKVWRIL
jgi:hypothetical protein